MKHNEPFEDDGRTVADMSGIEHDSIWLPRRRKQGHTPAQQPQQAADRPWEEDPQLTGKERLWAILGALKATLLICGVYLLGLLALLALLFLVLIQGGGKPEDYPAAFRCPSSLYMTLVTAGSLLLLAAAALRLVSGGMAGLELILSVFLACSGAAVLYELIAQRRSGAFAPTALLVPVCFLVVQLIVTYRANARDSVLGHFYVELLLLAALCLASLYLAAFAYRCGAPRSFAPAAHLALTLAAACCVDMALARRLDGLAACLGAALLLLAYLEAAGDFEG